MRTRTSIVTIATVLAAVPASGVAPAGAADRAAAGTSSVTLRVAATDRPALATFAGGRGVLLVGRRLGGGGTFATLSRDAGQHWSSVARLSSGPSTGQAVALDPRGRGAAVWFRPRRQQLVVRVRTALGRWRRARVFAHAASYDPAQVRVNAHGAVAVGYVSPVDGAQHVAFSRDGRHWRRTTVPGQVASPIALDDHGVVHAAVLQRDHGGFGLVSTTRLAPGHRWTRLHRVATGTDLNEDVGLAVDPGGREWLAVGTVGHWWSTEDTDYYWATAHEVLRQRGVSGSSAGTYDRVWQRDGARSLALSTSPSGARLTWEQWEQPADTSAAPRPRRVALLTQPLAPATGAVLRLAQQSYPSHGDASYGYDVSAPSGSRAGLLWRASSAQPVQRDVVDGAGLTSQQPLPGSSGGPSLGDQQVVVAAGGVVVSAVVVGGSTVEVRR